MALMPSNQRPKEVVVPSMVTFSGSPARSFLSIDTDAMPGKSSSAKSPAPAIAIRATPMRQGSVAALSPPGIGMDSR